MKRRLLWLLLSILAVGTVVMFWTISLITQRTELGMSYIDPIHQQQILDWGATAEAFYSDGQHQHLEEWLQQLQQQEQTWAAVVSAQLTPLANSELPPSYLERFRLGRNVTWKIHLYFDENPTMGVPFSDRQSYFLIKLPQRMRPGAFLPLTQILLQIALPALVLTAVSLLLYYHLISPLKKLDQATRAFSQCQQPVPIRPQLGDRNDEITALADTFDRMTERISTLIRQQRELIANLSHELRTPLARLEIAIDCLHHDWRQQESLHQLSHSVTAIRCLAEDTLTLAWLENEQPDLRTEQVELQPLVDVVCEDARFEFPDRELELEFNTDITLHNSSHRALGQALENLIRNGLRHTPPGKTVNVRVTVNSQQCCIDIVDQGPGVSDEHLPKLFQPFYRVPQDQLDPPTPCPGLTPVSDSTPQHQGFGLGLTLALRQIEAIGGTLTARRSPVGGLHMSITLPIQSVTIATRPCHEPTATPPAD